MYIIFLFRLFDIYEAKLNQILDGSAVLFDWIHCLHVSGGDPSSAEIEALKTNFL